MQPRTWLLLRKWNESKSLFFMLNVHIEEDEPAVFGATVGGLEDRMVATGQSVDEAEGNAVDMFKAIVDHTLETRVPLGIPYVVVTVKLEEAEPFFKAMMDALDSEPEDPELDWRSVPTSLLVAAAEPTLTA